MNISVIRKLKTVINKTIKKLSPIKRNRKISFKDVIYYCSLMSVNNYSYDTVNCSLKIHNITSVKKSALVNKRKNISYECFEKLNNELLDYVYKNCAKKRFIAVDGSTILLKKELAKEGFKYGSQKYYCKALVSSLYDIEKQLPINVSMFKHFNERKALISQLSFIKKNDVLILDRGYWSFELFSTLKKSKIDAIFRLKSNLKIIKNFNEKKANDLVLTLNGDQIRIIKYKIKKNIYYIGTTLLNKKKYDVNFFKYTYWSRWDVETNFRCLKYDMSLSKINLLSENKIKQKIAIHNFIGILSAFIESILNKINDKKNYKINRKNSINMITNNLLYILLYKKITNKKIIKINRVLNIVKDVIIEIKKNRKYIRLKRRPTKDWTYKKYNFNKRRKYG